jgi:large subunit ribosomal protein L23
MLFKKKSQKKEKEIEEKKQESSAVQVSSSQPSRPIRVSSRILLRPIITEKATQLAAQNQYVFEVAQKANKIEIKKAVKELYNFWPLKVNIIKVKGKEVRYGRSRGRTKNRTKAIVTLKKGEKIDLGLTK